MQALGKSWDEANFASVCAIPSPNEKEESICVADPPLLLY